MAKKMNESKGMYGVNPPHPFLIPSQTDTADAKSKGLTNRDIMIHTEAGRVALYACHYGFRMRQYVVHYSVLFGECEDINGKITAAKMRALICTGGGQIARLITQLLKHGTIKRIDGKRKTDKYYLLTELGRNVRALYLATYRERYARLVKHIAKNESE